MSAGRARVTEFLLWESQQPPRSKKPKFYAVAQGRPVRERQLPFVLTSWEECSESVTCFKPTLAHLSTTKGVFFKSFNDPYSAAEWLVNAFTADRRAALLQYIANN